MNHVKRVVALGFALVTALAISPSSFAVEEASTDARVTAKTAPAVAGIVSDYDGIALSNAHVTLQRADRRGGLAAIASTVTDAFGRYSVATRGTGDYVLAVAAEGYNGRDVAFSVKGSRIPAVDVSLQKWCATIRGVVSFSREEHWVSTGISKATVSFHAVTGAGWNPTPVAVVDVEGPGFFVDYESPLLPFGSYHVRFDGPLHKPSSYGSPAAGVDLTPSTPTATDINGELSNFDCGVCHKD